MNTVWIVLPVLIVLMFQLGIQLDRRSFGEVARHPAAVGVGLVGQLVMLPLIAWCVGVIFRLPPPLFLGLLLVACSPGGSSSNVFSMLAGGHVALSVSLTALSSVITLFTIPLVMEFGVRFTAVEADMRIVLPIGNLLVQNLVLLLLPLLCGVLFRHWRRSLALRVHAVLGRMAFPALLLLAGLFFVQHRETLAGQFGRLGAAVLLLLVLALAGGSLLARLFGFSSSVRRTLVIEIGMQNAAQAIAVATSPLVFNRSEMAVPAIVYALLMNVVLLAYLGLLRRRGVDAAV